MKTIKEKNVSPLDWPKEETTTFTAISHKPWETCYVVIANAHGCYPEMCGGMYDTLEEAENSLAYEPYGGRIVETTWGKLTETKF
jgi:hypothetical protein